ncbi:hypothetical protein [Micromonospora aurantiaca (nom. illeg.)]|uniref:hypothetical protein n=1 Tax=Micromonospora aurantiaca (nom. illeg.) TaxID=47850 RepID=UPI0033D27E1E
MTRATQDVGTSADPLLTTALAAAVPLHLMQMRTWSAERRATARAEDTQTISSHGDDLQFGGKHCAAAFNALARGLAQLADAPTGVTFAGLHWCTSAHDECPNRRPRTD